MWSFEKCSTRECPACSERVPLARGFADRFACPPAHPNVLRLIKPVRFTSGSFSGDSSLEESPAFLVKLAIRVNVYRDPHVFFGRGFSIPTTLQACSSDDAQFEFAEGIEQV